MSPHTARIPSHALLTKIDGSATSVATLKEAIRDADAVLITVGTKNKRGTTLFSDIALTLVRAAEEIKLTAPVLVITGFGAGRSGSYLGFLMRTVIRLFLKDQYENKTRMEEIIALSSLQWEMVRPGRLTDGPLTQAYQVIPHLHQGMRVKSVSRADVAHFLVTEAEHPTRLHQYPTLTH